MGEVLDRTDLLVTISSTAALESLHRRIPTVVLTDLGVREVARQPPLRGLRLPRLLGPARRRARAVARRGVGGPAGRRRRGTPGTEARTRGPSTRPARASPSCSASRRTRRPSPPTTPPPPRPAICPASSPATTSARTAARCPAPPTPTGSRARSGRSCAGRRAAPTGTACSAWRPSSAGWGSCDRPPPAPGARIRALRRSTANDQPGSRPERPRAGAPRARGDPRAGRLQGRARQEPRSPSAAYRWWPARCASAVAARLVTDVVVSTDDQAIAAAAREAGAEVVLPARRHRRRHRHLRGRRPARHGRPRGPARLRRRRRTPRPVHQPLHRPRGHRRGRRRGRRERRGHRADRGPFHGFIWRDADDDPAAGRHRAHPGRRRRHGRRQRHGHGRRLRRQPRQVLPPAPPGPPPGPPGDRRRLRHGRGGPARAQAPLLRPYGTRPHRPRPGAGDRRPARPRPRPGPRAALRREPARRPPDRRRTSTRSSSTSTAPRPTTGC